jgi:outer membrane protein OmpA-like peptidoglycan-associated protein
MMKHKQLAIVLTLTALILAGCGLQKMVKRYPEVSITLDNPDLENKGGKVDYTIKGNIPPKYMNKKAVVTVQPTIKSATGEVLTTLPPITLAGEKAKVDGATVIPYKAGGKFTKSGSFDFDEEMTDSEIYAVTTAALKKKSQHLTPDRNLGEGISNSSSLMDITPSISDNADNGNGTFFLFAPHGYKAEYETETADIYFEVNSSSMNWNLPLNKRAEAKQGIKDLVDFLYKGGNIEKVVISGWASPEGEESHNQGLSERRFEQGKKWFNEQYDKYVKQYCKDNNIKLKDFQKPELKFENNAKGEDWDGFEAAVEQSSIPERNKILNVVRSQPNNDLREQRIREMTDIYNEIADQILPPLRRAEISLVYNKNQYNDQEIAKLASSDPSKLNLNERLYAAAMAQSNATKADIYTGIINDSQYENDWRAYNNLATLKLNDFYTTGNPSYLDEANNLLNKAAAISPDNGIILNNKAIAAFFAGNLNEAKQLFKDSQNASVNPVNQSYNNGMFKILEGDFDGAAQALANTNCDYNTALSQLLKKNYTAAKNTLDCVTSTDAKVYYLRAVLAARTADEYNLYKNLGAAIDKDPKYKRKAKRDAEFKKYRKTTEFQNLVK